MPAHRRFRTGRAKAHCQQCADQGAATGPGQVVHGHPGVFEDLHYPDMSVCLGATAAEGKAELGAREMPAEPLQILRVTGTDGAGDGQTGERRCALRAGRERDCRGGAIGRAPGCRLGNCRRAPYPKHALHGVEQ